MKNSSEAWRRIKRLELSDSQLERYVEEGGIKEFLPTEQLTLMVAIAKSRLGEQNE